MNDLPIPLENARLGRNHRRPLRRERRGILLFVVVIVIAMLALGGISLLALMRVEREATLLRLQELQLDNVNRSAVTLIQTLGEMPESERERYGGFYDNPKLFCGMNVLSRDDGARDDVAFTILSPKFERDRIEGIRYGLVNESTKLNLGAILAWDTESPGIGRETLMKLPGMTPTMADSLLDWIDDDEQTRPQGAEGSYYASQHLPYSPRNALPVFLEELLLVRDVTRYQLYGEDENFNFGDIVEKTEGRGSFGDGSAMIGSLSTPPERPKSGGVETGAGQSAPPIAWNQLLTVFSAERDADPNGDPRIDLNGDDLSFLFDELSSYVSEEAATFAVLFRQYGPAAPEESEGRTAVKSDADAIDFDLAPSFRFETPLDLVGVSVFVPGAENPEEGTLYKSPFPDNRRTLSGLLDYLDYASTGSETVITGRVNINEAPRPVLEAIPGFTPIIVTRILNSRGTPGSAVSPEHRHAAWLYADGIVDLETMRSLWPKLTTGGGVFRGQVVGFIEGRGASRRGEVAVDTTVSPARQVFYKDLTMYGQGFPNDILLDRHVDADAVESRLETLIESGEEEAAPFLDVETAPPPDDPFRAFDY